MSEKYDSRKDTVDHIMKVRRISDHLVFQVNCQVGKHDASKLMSEEKEVFDRVTPELRSLTYGSEEYKKSLASMGSALEHHYKNNRHHPEHFENGIDGMDLVDVLEMFCDWKAATERHADGDINKSIQINSARFKMSPQLVNIFKNTLKRFS